MESESYFVPATHSQERLWWAERRSGDRSLYVLPTFVRISPTGIDRGALMSAALRVARRHEALRTTFLELDGRLVQRVAREATLDIHQMQGGPDAYGEIVGKPIGILDPVLWDLHLFRGVDEDGLLLRIHHALADGPSVELIVRHLADEFRGDSTAIESARFSDYVTFMSRSSPGTRNSANYWSDRMAGWEGDQFSLRSMGEGSSEEVNILLSSAQVGELRTVAASSGATLFHVLLDAAHWATAALAGTSDTMIGVAHDNRPVGFRDCVGFFTEMVPHRMAPSTAYLPRDARIRTVAETFLLDVQHFSPHALRPLEEMFPSRDAQSTGLFQVGLTFEGAPPEYPMLGSYSTLADLNHSHSFGRVLGSTRFLLEFGFRTRPDGSISGYASAADQIGGLHAARASVRQFMQRISLVSEPGPSSLAEGRPTPTQSSAAIDHVLRNCVELSDRVAIEDGDLSITYGQLGLLVMQLAREVESLGASGRQVRVATLLERGWRQAVATVAINAAGACYLPLDKSSPGARLDQMLDVAHVDMVLADSDATELSREMRTRLWRDVDRLISLDRAASLPYDTPQDLSIHSDLAACVIFTSGTTGTPKGVEISHKGIARTCVNSDYVQISVGTRVASVANPAFDASTFELWSTLAAGGVLVIAPDSVARDPEKLVSFLAESSIEVVLVTTALLNAIASTPDRRRLPEGIQILFGGEAASPLAVRKLLLTERGASFVNLYGPTECSVIATAHPVVPVSNERWHEVPIGRPIQGTQALVMSADLIPTPVGLRGFLYLAGDGLATSYVGMPRETAASFLPNPFGPPGSRVYSTGDTAILRSGVLSYAGRIDDQVKIRGFRVELDEVAAAIRDVLNVNEVSILLFERRENDPEIGAVIAGPSGVPENWRDLLGQSLPGYMIPSALLSVLELPLTRTGKVDKATLLQLLVSHRVDVAPGADDRKVERMSATWAKVFGRSVHPDEGFLEAGGHSLLASRLAAAIRAEFDCDVPLSFFLDGGTIRLTVTEFGLQETP